jgi:hypothetical protein
MADKITQIQKIQETCICLNVSYTSLFIPFCSCMWPKTLDQLFRFYRGKKLVYNLFISLETGVKENLSDCPNVDQEPCQFFTNSFICVSVIIIFF